MARTWITKVNNVDTVDAAHVNDLQTYKLDKDELPYVRPEDYGAVGDGVTDDTVAIQAAINAALAGGAEPINGKVVFNPTKHYVCGSVTVPTTMEIDGQGCIITATGNPEHIFLVDAQTWMHHIKIHDFEMRGNSTNRIRVLGGQLYNSEIHDIFSRTGTVTDAIVKFYNNSDSNSCGVNKIYNISGGGPEVSGYHKYAIHFDKASPTNLNWDTTDYDNISLGSTVVGAATIRVENDSYCMLSRFNKIFFGGIATDNSPSYVMSGWFDRCSFSHIYGEFGANSCANCAGFYARCSFSDIHNYNDTVAPTGIRCISGLLQGCDFSQMSMVGSTGAALYASTAYPVITDTDTSNGNTITFPLNYVDNAVSGLLGLNWNVLRDYSLLADQDVRSGAMPVFDGVYVTGATDVITDGGLELWDNPTTPTSPWVKGTAGTSTVNQASGAGNIHGGTYACRFDIDSSGNTALVYQPITLVALKPHKLSLWYKTAAFVTALLSLSDSGGNVLVPQGTWTGVGGNGFVLPAVTAWTNYVLYFYSHVGYTSYTFQLQNYQGASCSIFLDDVSICASSYLGTPFGLDEDCNLTASHVYKVGGTQVVGAQAAAQANLKADYTTGDLDSEAEIIAAINATNAGFNTLLAKLRTHGLIDT